MFGLGKKLDARFWDAVLAGNQSQVMELIGKDPQLVEVRRAQKLCEEDASAVEQATPLHAAVARGAMEMVQLLLSVHAPVDATSGAGTTPLHEAAARGHFELVSLLLRRNATVDARDNRGQTPLHKAAAATHESVVKLLLDHGASVEAVDEDGYSVLHHAAAGGCEDTVSWLLEAGANVNALTKDKQRTALHLVIMNADHSQASRTDPNRRSMRARMERIARSLLDHRADPNAVDGKGETPLDVFNYVQGDDENDPLVQMLRKYGGHWVRYHHRHPKADAELQTHAPPAAQAAPSGQSTSGYEAVSAAPERTSGSFSRHEPRGEPIALGTGTTIIGRRDDCDVRYRSRTLSRHHAQIDCERGEYIIRDLGSHNGVVINGQRIGAPHLLTPGEHITLGAYEFEFNGSQLIPLSSELSEAELQAELSR